MHDLRRWPETGLPSVTGLPSNAVTGPCSRRFLVSMIRPHPDVDPRSSSADPTAIPPPQTSSAPAQAGRRTTAMGIGEVAGSLRQPWSSPQRRRAGSHLSTGLRSPLSWLVYALLGAILIARLHDHWREALLAFACTALLAAFWLLATSRRHPPRDDQTLLEQIDLMAGLEFESWIVDQLRASGLDVRNVRDSGDFGVDIITWRHGLAIGLQPKRYLGKVGNDAIQQVLAGCDYHGCQLAVVLTQSSFTAPAREQAEKGRHPVVLIERAQLLDFVTVLDVAAADPGIRRRILHRRSLAVYGLDRAEGFHERTADVGERPPPTPEDGSGQEAAEHLVAERYAAGTEAQR